MGHVTHDMWHVTCDTWHVTHGGGWTFSQNVSSLTVTVWVGKWFEDLEENAELLNQIINSNEAVCRTRPASLGLLITTKPYQNTQEQNNKKRKSQPTIPIQGKIISSEWITKAHNKFHMWIPKFLFSVHRLHLPCRIFLGVFSPKKTNKCYKNIFLKEGMNVNTRKANIYIQGKQEYISLLTNNIYLLRSRKIWKLSSFFGLVVNIWPIKAFP